MHHRAHGGHGAVTEKACRKGHSDRGECRAEESLPALPPRPSTHAPSHDHPELEPQINADEKGGMAGWTLGHWTFRVGYWTFLFLPASFPRAPTTDNRTPLLPLDIPRPPLYTAPHIGGHASVICSAAQPEDRRFDASPHYHHTACRAVEYGVPASRNMRRAPT